MGATEQFKDSLEMQGLDPSEAAEVADMGASDRSPERVNRISAGYLHTTNPDTGDAVVFMPGERLPDWAWAIQNPTPDTEADTEPVKRKSIRSVRQKAADSEPAP